MGHSKASKADTRARLVSVAAARFKERGVDGISLADLMKELDLTHGGFYKHFNSRDELVGEAVDAALAASERGMRERLFDGDKPDLAGFVKYYLSEAHRDELALGCAVSALSGDAARNSPDLQARFRAQIERNLEMLSDALIQPPGERRDTAIALMSSLYGALIMARAVGKESPLSREILRTMGARIAQFESPPRTAAQRSARGKRKSAK